jgi:hypothetical protein
MTRPHVLYVGGWGRSGSTLLSHLLGRLPDMVSAGEIRYVWQGGVKANELCGCGEAFADCPFWTAVGDEAFGGWENVDIDEVLSLESDVLRHSRIPRLAAPRFFPAHAARLERYAEITGQLYNAIATVAGAGVVVDSTKNPPYAYFLRRSGAVDLKVVHLVRDSRGVVFSWMKKVVRPEITEGDAHFEEFKPVSAGFRWMECNLAFEVLRRLRTPTVRLRYESLATDPRGEVSSTLHRLGIDPPPESLDELDGGEVEVLAQHSIRGNPMRFDHGRQQVRVDDAWRTGMAKPVRRMVTMVTWPLLLQYGYLRQGSRES